MTPTLFTRAGLRRKGRPGTLRASSAADVEHLAAFVASRRGVEAFLEPRTAVTDTTLLLVADTGEWTRRRVESPKAAQAFAKKLALPLYDANLVGVPARVRAWNEAQKRR